MGKKGKWNQKRDSKTRQEDRLMSKQQIGE
jgi:hypothetical protein